MTTRISGVYMEGSNVNMKHAGIMTILLVLLLLLILALWVPMRFLPGMSFAGGDKSRNIYFNPDSLKIADYDDGGRYLDVFVRIEYHNVPGLAMIEEATWHIDAANGRYKVSFPITYNCEGTALET